MENERLRLIICGGRDYRLTKDDYDFLTRVDQDHDVAEVVSGGCAGADTDGEEWAKGRGIPVKQFIPDWVTEGKKAGPLRNQEMAEYATACVAFPGGNGTKDMLARARQHCSLVWDLTDN